MTTLGFRAFGAGRSRPLDVRTRLQCATEAVRNPGGGARAASSLLRELERPAMIDLVTFTALSIIVIGGLLVVARAFDD